MADRQDPIQRVDDGSTDLYDVVTWEERSRLDRLAGRVHRWLLGGARAVVVLLAVLIVVAQFALTGLAAVGNPVVGAYVLLSVVPALGLAAYVWKADVTRGEPLHLLVVTFLLGFLLAGFAAVLNSYFEGGFAAVPLVGTALFFFVVVGPVEETVKWLAVRLYAYRSDDFDAVVDGAVYGAFAGLGFATIENTLFITQGFLNATAGGQGAMLDAALQTAAARTLAGPGHVIYSAFAGYYLGLAKFNPADRGPIVVKGLLIAVFIHGLYNTSVTSLPYLVTLNPVLARFPPGVVFLAFVLIYDGVFGFFLYRKLSRYREAYEAAGAGVEPADEDPGGPSALAAHEGHPGGGDPLAVPEFGPDPSDPGPTGDGGDAGNEFVFPDDAGRDRPGSDRGTDEDESDDAAGGESADAASGPDRSGDPPAP